MTSRPRRIPAVAALLLSLVWIGPLAAQEPALAFSTSPQNQPVTLTLNEPKLRYELNLDSLKKAEEGTAEPGTKVQVVATPFRDASGNTIQPTVTVPKEADGSSTVPPLGSLPVVIEADLPKPGVYTSHISLVYNGQRWTPPLALTVTRAAPDVDVTDDLPAASAALWGLERNKKVVVDVGIYDKNGQTLNLPVPQLLRFVLKRDNGSKLSSKASFEILGPDSGKLPNPLTVDGKKTRQLRFLLSGFQEAGEHEATLRFIPDGVASPIDRTFSVYVREPLLAALFWIALGVVTSYLIREYLIKTRPRLAALARIESLTVDLEKARQDPALTDRQKEVIGSLLSQVTDLRKAIRLETMTLTEVDGALDLLEKKVPLLKDWISVSRRASVLHPIPANIAAPLQEVEAALGDRNATTQVITQAGTKLAAAAAAIPPPAGARAAAPLRTAMPQDDAKQNLSWLLSRIRSSDLLVTVVILLIACLMGIKALWISDLGWGGWEDRVIAVLWGLGLHQATFTGVEALRTTLAR